MPMIVGGGITSKSGSMADINPFRYRGYYYDTETGFYYLQSRYYDPEICRFINADSYDIIGELSQVMGQLNLYAYCNNNPIMNTDPTGEKIDWAKVLAWLGVGAIIIAAFVCMAPVALGFLTATSLGGSILVGTGVGILAGVGGSIIAQGGLSNIANIDPLSVLISGVIGGVIGAFSGAMSYGLSQMGQMFGQGLGYTLNNASYIGNGAKFGKILNLTTSGLMKMGGMIGGVAGGTIGGFTANYVANSLVESTFGKKYKVDNPNYIRSGILKFFQWMYA